MDAINFVETIIVRLRVFVPSPYTGRYLGRRRRCPFMLILAGSESCGNASAARGGRGLAPTLAHRPRRVYNPGQNRLVEPSEFAARLAPRLLLVRHIRLAEVSRRSRPMMLDYRSSHGFSSESEMDRWREGDTGRSWTPSEIGARRAGL